MTFFKNLLQRTVATRPASEFNPADPFAGQGFVYTDTVTSPDGAIQIFNGYSGGEKSATIVEPMMVLAATGRVLVDLWKTYQDHEITFVDNASAAEMRVYNTHNGRQCIVFIDFANETFAFKQNPAARHALAKLPDMISLF